MLLMHDPALSRTNAPCVYIDNCIATIKIADLQLLYRSGHAPYGPHRMSGGTCKMGPGSTRSFNNFCNNRK